MNPPMPANLRGFKTGAPGGFTTLRNPSRQVSAKAKELLSNKMGEEFKFNIAGVDYFARLEPHYHPPGYVGGPNGWHKGVSVYVSKSALPSTPNEVQKPQETPSANTEKLPILPEKKPKYNFIAELDKIFTRLMG